MEQTFGEAISGTGSAAEEPVSPATDATEEVSTETETVETEETPAESSTEEAEEPQQTDEQTEEAQEPTAPADPKAELEALIQRYAKEMGLDPNDPAHRKALKRIADSQLYIQQLKAGQKPETETQDASGLTEFERELLGGDEAETETAAPAAAETKPTADAGKGETLPPGKYGDVGDSWKSPRDSYQAEAEAWQAGDLEKVHDIQVARLNRISDAVIGPKVVATVNQMLDAFAKQHLGDVLPKVRENLAVARQAENRTFAIAELAKVPGYEELNAMFRPDDETLIEFDSGKFANNAFNRIVKANPGILKINVDRGNDGRFLDPDTAQRLTLIERYRMAMNIHRDLQKINTDKAKQFLKAGAEQVKRAEKDKVRQSLNSGSGTTGGSKPPAPDGEQSFESLVG